MANIREALTTRLARERLEAIKKFLPVRGSVRQKLQLRQQAEEGFAEDVEELFKPVTKSTEAVKTAIVGRTLEDVALEGGKPQRGLFQAIEELKDQHPGAVATVKETFINKFTEDGIEEIKNIPLSTPDELREFSFWIVKNYHRRQDFLKPGADRGMTQAEWRDYVYKVHWGISRISKTDDTYNFIKTGVIGVNKALRDQRKKEEKIRKITKIQAEGERKKTSKRPALQEEPTATGPVFEFLTPGTEQEEEFYSPSASPPPDEREQLERQKAILVKQVHPLNEEFAKLKSKPDKDKTETNRMKELSKNIVPIKN